MRVLSLGFGIIILLSYFILWQKATKNCCINNLDAAIIDSSAMNHSNLALSFCYGSSELVSHRSVNSFMDSVRKRIETGWSLKITTYVDSSEYIQNENLGIDRAESLMRFFKNIDSKVQLSYDIEVLDSLYHHRDSCSNLFKLEFVPKDNFKDVDSILIIQHIDGKEDLVVTESALDKLDKVLTRMKQTNESIQIISFLIEPKYNKTDFNLARNRGKVIKNYLVESGAESKSIQLNYEPLTKYTKEYPKLNLQLNQSLIKFIK